MAFTNLLCKTLMIAIVLQCIGAHTNTQIKLISFLDENKQKKQAVIQLKGIKFKGKIIVILLNDIIVRKKKVDKLCKYISISICFSTQD